MSPEDYKDFLKNLDWTDLHSMFEAQAIAADDVTLTNIYIETSTVVLRELKKFDPK